MITPVSSRTAKVLTDNTEKAKLNIFAPNFDFILFFKYQALLILVKPDRFQT